jgi:tetratricopeptide (TPR) repeat protein
VSLPNGDKPNLWNQILLINSELDDLEAIKVESKAAIELFPAQPLPYVLLGFAYLRDSSWQKAVTILEEGKMYAMGNRPLEAQFLTFLADAHHHLGNHATSDKYFERILEANPNDVAAMNNYAYYLSLRQEKLDKALTITKRSNELSKDNPMFLDTWAWVHFQRGEYNEALKLMDRVAAFGIESGEVWEHYGDILAKLGRMEEAIAAWEKAFEIGGVNNEKVQIKIQKRQYVQ